jgi:predicted MPP superfamily phosphohydrolase
MVVGLAVGVQVPAWLAIARLTGRPAVAVAVAALMLVPALSTARNPWEHRPRSRVELYLLMWPFFAWWTTCLLFAALAPIAILVAAASALSLDASLAAAGGLAVAGAAATLSRRPRICTHTVAIPGLPEAFTGYRIAQLSDLHCGPFTPPARVRRWVEAANDLDADLIAVTGDLITSGADYVPAVAAVLGGLRAPDGVFGCMGNHDYFTDGERFARELTRHGMQLLRNRGLVIDRPGGRPVAEDFGTEVVSLRPEPTWEERERVPAPSYLYLAGVDDTWTHRHDLDRALAGRPAGAPVILLAHDPLLFPAAAARGVALTLSGHTHGGQLAVPLAPRRWNLARLVTEFTAGLYKIGDAVLYVNRGLGTTGPPIRLGVRPEIALFTLMPADPEEEERLRVAEDIIRDASDPR